MILPPGSTTILPTPIIVGPGVPTPPPCPDVNKDGKCDKPEDPDKPVDPPVDVPEPATWTILIAGALLLWLGLFAPRRRQR